MNMIITKLEKLYENNTLNNKSLIYDVEETEIALGVKIEDRLAHI